MFVVTNWNKTVCVIFGLEILVALDREFCGAKIRPQLWGFIVTSHCD
jgi:hypothetical protein